MIALALILHTLFIITMLVTVMWLEKDCKKIMLWSLIIVVTSIIGFVVYFIFFCDKPRIKNTIKLKFEQDEIYKRLMKVELSNTTSSNEFINFNKRHYSADVFQKSDIETITNLDEFVNRVATDIENAKSYIIVENEVFLASINNENIIALLKEKQSMGVEVKCVYGKRNFKDREIIKDLRNAGVRVCRFNRTDSFNKYYKNNKNIISIDGEQVYLYSYLNHKCEDKVECSHLYFNVKGNIVKAIDLDCHLDLTFATQKVYELPENIKYIDGELEVQYVTSVVDKDFEGLFLKAINDARKSIIIHIDKFIPTPAIKQALHMAIMSGVEVKIMLAKNNHTLEYYSSRAYLKEMAMYGASGYLFDGQICSSFIVIDDLTLAGNFSLVNLEIRNNLQNVLIVNNDKFSKDMVEYFNDKVNNSYRICKPKNTLLREKIFKKFN